MQVKLTRLTLLGRKLYTYLVIAELHNFNLSWEPTVAMGTSPGPIRLPESRASRCPDVHVESVDVCSVHVVPE